MSSLNESKITGIIFHRAEGYNPADNYNLYVGKRILPLDLVVTRIEAEDGEGGDGWGWFRIYTVSNDSKKEEETLFKRINPRFIESIRYQTDGTCV